jgi:hypothetical protein
MDNTLSLQDAIECAKNFKNFQGILLAVSLHPEWLTTIAENRKWAMIHHIVYSGNIDHLDQLLALQKMNPKFNLLVQSRNHETILDVAKVLDDERKMFTHIERLAKLDEMLNYAKDCQWDKCYEIVQDNPNYGNEKPPYRRFYLIHHIACANEIEQFERFQKIKGFDFTMNLRAERKKINVIAREGNGVEFAKYIERNYPTYFQDDKQDDKLYEPSDEAKKHTNDINILMERRNIPQEPDLSFGPIANVVTRGEADHKMKQKLIKQQQELQQQQQQAKKPILEHPIDTIRILLTCSLTHAIVTDPGQSCNEYLK